MSGPTVRRRPARRPQDLEARALAESTDELNAVFDSAAEHLAALGLGVGASVSLDRGVDPATGVHYGRDLVFTKRGDQWRLFVADWADHDDEPLLTPITSAPRNDRVAAAHKLPELLAAMRTAVRAETDRVREAKNAVESFLASLRSDEVEP